MKEFNIYFEYNEEKIKIPINPEELTKNISIDNETTEVIGVGEVAVIKSPKLMALTIDSFIFEEDKPENFYSFFEKVKEEAKPVRVICKDFNLNMLVSIVNFEWTVKAGEEGNRYFNLELQEWRDYSPIVISKEQTTKQANEEIKDTAKENKNNDINKNDIVKFNGGFHYHTSQDSKPTGKPRTAGNAKLTLIASGSKHPYHLIGEPNGSDVYGWVDEGSFTK